MARSNRRVFQLAQLVGCDISHVLRVAQEFGITVTNENDLIPKEQHRRVLTTLQSAVSEKKKENLPAQPESPQKLASKPDAPRRPYSIKLIGHPNNEISYLWAKAVIDIHWVLVEDFATSQDPIEPPGLRDENLLESALHRVHTSLGRERKYPTVPMAAAAYLHAIIGNHAFHNGNKRTALVATLVFLDLNRFVLNIEEDQLYSYLINIAKHEIVKDTEAVDLADAEMEAIAEWLHRRIRRLSRQEKIIKFHKLMEILNNYGCEYQQPTHGNRINIIRGNYKTQIRYRNDGTDVNPYTIRKVRRDLHLAYEDGYDSNIFYDKGKRIPEFINKYRHTLNRLAKV